jgi:hypothetical protein
MCLPVRKTFAANTDTFQHTVTGQLVKHEGCIDKTASFLLVGDNATNKVWVSLNVEVDF